jgi:hypothetical protein
MANPRLIAFALLTLFLFAAVSNADIAPPTMHINVTYKGSSGMPVNGTFNVYPLVCANSTNISNVTVPKLNLSFDTASGCYWVPAEMSGATCESGWCDLYYFPTTSFKLAFYLPSLNKTFVTNETNQSSFGTTYDVSLYQNGSATITAFSIPTPPPTPQTYIVLFAAALVLTVAIEVATAFLYLRFVKIKKKARILVAVIVANIISVPVLWFIFVYFLGALGFILGELFAFLFEGGFVYYFNKKAIKLKSSMIMSLIMNITSLVLGVLIIIALSGLL